MSMPPKTVLAVSEEEAEAIRHAVRTADVTTLGEGRARADLHHVEGLVALLSDERVSGPIYDLPRPIDAEAITRWVAESQAQALAGEALLIVTLDPDGAIAGYSRITVWPDRSAAELAGAVRADRQNQGQGGRGMAHSFGWIFETLGVRMMCLTAALDNIRVQKGIDGAGFTRMGERDAVRPDGSIRRSIYWEMARDAWRIRHRL
jgi:RimJ/RimL family protein N-acetyltransferase